MDTTRTMLVSRTSSSSIRLAPQTPALTRHSQQPSSSTCTICDRSIDVVSNLPVNTSFTGSCSKNRMQYCQTILVFFFDKKKKEEITHEVVDNNVNLIFFPQTF